MRVFQTAWREVQDFAGIKTDATFLMPRWLALRAVGLVYVLIFAGIIADAPALIGERGILPLAGFFAEWREVHGHLLAAVWHAPSVFWLSHGTAMVALVGWSGLAAALALVLNLWPRLMLFTCWGSLLSFVAVWRGFSASQVDQLMLEAALVCLPFAPAGLRPGLGADSPPCPIAIFTVRWFLFRVMFESGLVKIFAGDPHWLNFTALDVLYETSPFPTVFGYLDHQMPHAWHVVEVGLTFGAEIIAPLVAVFAGRSGRWWALLVWTGFQAGIQLTNNFGWLNTASIGVGLFLLDDQMIAAAARPFSGLNPNRWFAAPGSTNAQPPGAWARHGLRGALGLHFILTLYFFALNCGLPLEGFPYAAGRPLKELFWDFRSANSYTLFAGMLPSRIAVEFEGSNDGGVTWRTYEFNYQPQDPARISPFIAPRYARFEATLQVEANRPEPSPLFAHVAAQLLAGNPDVLRQFRRNPFPDGAPLLVRFPVYELKFTDLARRRATGHYWRKELTGFQRPMLYRSQEGLIREAQSALDEVRVQATQGNPGAQNRLGLAYANGTGLPPDPAQALRWFRTAADRGHAEAQVNAGLALLAGAGGPRDAAQAAAYFRAAATQGHARAQYQLGICHARGEGVAPDPAEAAKWYQLAALQGLAGAQGRLGSLYLTGEGVPHDAREAARWLLRSASQGNAYAQANLGLLYAKGEGVAADEIEALAWFKLAAGAGDLEAGRNQAIAERRLGPAGITAAEQRLQQLRGDIAAATKN